MRAGARMRRLDWFLAAVVAAFLISAAVVEAHLLTFDAVPLARPPLIGVGEVTVRRLVSQLPHSPILPGDAQ